MNQDEVRIDLGDAHAHFGGAGGMADIDMGSGTLTLSDTIIEAYDTDSLTTIGPPQESGQILVSTKKGGNQAIKWETAANVKEWTFGISTARTVYGCYFQSARIVADRYTQCGYRYHNLGDQAAQIMKYKKTNRKHRRHRPAWYYVYSNRTLGKEAGGITYSNMMYHAFQDFWDYQDNFMGRYQQNGNEPASYAETGQAAFPYAYQKLDGDNNPIGPRHVAALTTSGCTLSDIAFKAFASGGYKNFGLPIPQGPVITDPASGLNQELSFSKFRDHERGYHMRPWPVQSRANLNLWWGLAEKDGDLDGGHQSCYLDDQYQHGLQGAGKHKFDWWRRILQIRGEGLMYDCLWPSDIFSGPYSFYGHSGNNAHDNWRVNPEYPTYRGACDAGEFDGGPGGDAMSIHKALRSTRDLAPSGVNDTIHKSKWGAAGYGNQKFVPLPVDMVLPQTPFSPGAWGHMNFNWSTHFTRSGHASHPWGGSYLNYQKYPSIVYEHPSDIVGSYAMTYLGSLGGGPPMDGSKFLTKIKLKWRCPNGIKVRFIARPCWTAGPSSFNPERWTWGCYRRFYETFGGSGGYVQNHCNLWRIIFNEILELEDSPQGVYCEANVIAKACVRDSIAYPLKIFSNGRIKVHTVSDFCRNSYNNYFTYKGAGTQPSQGDTSPYNRRFNFDYYDARTTYTIFRQGVTNNDYQAYFEGFTMDNYDAFVNTDDRYAVMQNRHIIDMDGDNRNTPFLPLWDGSRAYFTGQKSPGGAWDKRRTHRWLRRVNSPIGEGYVTESSGVSAGDIATTPLEQGPNDSIHPTNDYLYDFDDDGQIVGLREASFGHPEGNHHMSPLTTNQWTLTHTYKDFLNPNNEDNPLMNPGNLLYDGDTIGGFNLYYNFANNTKPRTFNEYIIDASHTTNPMPIEYYGRQGAVFGGDSRLQTEGVIDLEAITKLEGNAHIIPVLITGCTVNSDFEFDCNEWSPKHAACPIIGGSAYYRQLYTDYQEDGIANGQWSDNPGYTIDGTIRRSAAGWSARTCIGSQPEGGVLLNAGYFTEPTDGYMRDLYNYTGVIEYQNDLAQRRDWNGRPVKVYEQFFYDPNGDVRLRTGKQTHTTQQLYMTVDEVIISR